MQQKCNFIIAFENVTIIADTEKLKGVEIYLPSNVLLELEGDQYYLHEIICYRIHDAKA